MSAPRRTRACRWSAALVIAWAALPVLLGGCDGNSAAGQSPATAATLPPPIPADRRSGCPASAPAVHDWVIAPEVDDAEKALPALRIASTAPSITEVCCALGLRACLVGRSRYCTYPPGIEQVPSLGALVDIDVERLHALKPDLVLVAGRSQAIRDKLDALQLKYVSIGDESLADIYNGIRRIGQLTGRVRTAERLCRGIQADVEAVAQRYAGGPKRRVLLLVGVLADPPRPPTVAGPGSFYDDLLRRVGQENVAPPGHVPFGALSLEYIVRVDPEVVIELDPDGRARPEGDADALRVWRKLGPLQAVAARRVHVIPGPQHYLPGPRIAETFEQLSRAIAGRQP